MGLAHGLQTLVTAAEKLHATDANIQFVLVGEGADRQRLIELARSRGLRNIRFVEQQPRENVPDYIALSDVCLVLLKKSDVFETVIPSKMLEFMSCARPIILGVAGQAREILERSRGGLCIEPENATALCEAILKLRDDARLRETFGRNGREYIAENFSRERTAADYLEVLRETAEAGMSAEAAVAA